MGDIKMTKEEADAFNILSGTVTARQAALQEAVDAQAAYLGLVGTKYHATFVPELGKFVGIEAGASTTAVPPRQHDPLLEGAE